MTRLRASLCVLLTVVVSSCGTSTLDVGHNPPAPVATPVAADGGAGPTFPALDAGPTSQPSWRWLNPQPTGNTLRAIWGVTNTDVWVVGGGSTVLHWDGEAWRSAYSGSVDDDFYGVYGATRDDVWIVGRDAAGRGKLLHSSRARDGQWSLDASLDGRLPYAIWGTSRSDVWLVIDHGDIAHFDGLKWSVTTGPAGGGTLRDLWGTSPSDVWVVGDAGRIAHFDGKGWTRRFTAPTFGPVEDYIGIWGSGRDDVWAVYQTASPSEHAQGRTGFVHWNGAALQVAQEESSTCPWVGRSNKGAIFDTHGATANLRSEPPEAPFRRGHRVWGVHASSALAVAGIDACPWHWDGHRWSIDAVAQLADDAPYEPEGLALWGGAPSALWLISHSGRLMRHDASAAIVDRTKLLGTPQSRYNDVFADLRDGLLHVAVQSGGAWATSVGRVLHFGPGGWSPVGNLYLGVRTFNALFVVSDSDVWVGAGGLLHHWNGEGWSPIELPPSAGVIEYDASIYAIWASGPRDVWVARGLDLLHFDGSTWTAVSRPAFAPRDGREGEPLFSGIAGTSASDVWVTAKAYNVPRSEQLIYHFDGVALTESSRTWLSEGAAYPSVWARAVDDAWVTTSPTLHWDGRTWEPAPPSIQQMAIPQNDSAFASTVWGRAADDVWFLSTSTQPQPFTRIMHWDGKAARVSFESRPVLSAISGDAAGSVWAVGSDGATLRLVQPSETETR